MSDVCTLSATSHHFKEMCMPENKLVISHLHGVNPSYSLGQVVGLVTRISRPMIQSLTIDAKKKSGGFLIKALISVASEMTSLTSLSVKFGGDLVFLEDFLAFISNLPSHQLVSVHFSGLRQIAHVGMLLENQCESIEDFQVDYFVNGHEKFVKAEFFPIMPRIKTLVFDVAELAEMPVELIQARLAAIQEPRLVERIYMPHVEILGETPKLCSFINLIKLNFNQLDQLVIRFSRLPLTVWQILSLRESFLSLPAVCISNHFVVCQKTWCNWWPSVSEIWSGPEQITGRAVFQEQIDFESLGTSATNEWLNLTSDQQEIWSRKIAPRVHQLYLEQLGK